MRWSLKILITPRWRFKPPDMNSENQCATPIQGQLLRLSERREVAIYLRKDALWVADFIDGHGELIDAATWFRFNCGAPATPHARRRMVVEAAIPLSGQLAARIECLHRSDAAPNSAAMVESKRNSGGEDGL